MEDWAEIRRLLRVEGLSQRAIARRLGIARDTVAAALKRHEPPRYRRAPRGSKLDSYKPRIGALLDQYPGLSGVRVYEMPRAEAYGGQLSILRDYLATQRPRPTAYQRTEYAPGELGQVDWLELPERVPETVAAYARQFATLGERASLDTWLVMHMPLWALRPEAANGGRAVLREHNPTLQAASGNRLPPGIARIISGHGHLFEALSFADGRPSQFVVGNGGTSLDPNDRTPLSGLEVGSTTIVSGTLIARFGFTTLECMEGDWVLTLRDFDGAPRATCSTQAASLTCTP